MRGCPAAGITPGPWTVETPMGDDILCIMQANKSINVATWVAQIGLERASDCDPGYDEAHANAQAIAALPDVLDILRRIAEWDEHPVEMAWTEKRDYYRSLALLALEKARSKPGNSPHVSREAC